jgi:hypothetical protein
VNNGKYGLPRGRISADVIRGKNMKRGKRKIGKCEKKKDKEETEVRRVK